MECPRYTMKQRCYRPHTVYSPFRETTPEGLKVHSQVNSADWWWDIQDRIPPGDTVVPLICSSDETHLTSHSGDMKGWRRAEGRRPEGRLMFLVTAGEGYSYQQWRVVYSYQRPEGRRPGGRLEGT
ncbi:hypothetical protein K440DRAFT_284131 [Wilcoxina mikolae CBS 423.85]|nr:hypothetical protein K440DRAFT_284131 [Wilcoxina mikolae CBS 423.85]